MSHRVCISRIMCSACRRVREEIIVELYLFKLNQILVSIQLNELLLVRTLCEGKIV